MPTPSARAAILAVTALAAPSALAQADATAYPVTILTDTATAPNGAWSWFEDERAIIDTTNPGGPLLLVSSVSSAPNGDQESGDIDLLWLNLSTGAKGHVEFHNRLERDDHDSAALWQRPDGRYVAAYGRHGSDNLTRYRTSTNPHDPTAWDAATTLDNGARATYNNLHYLPDDNAGAGRLYNFTRTTNWDPNVQTSDDQGATWSAAGKLITQGGSSDRPYARYFSDGDAIHFIVTEEHPRNFNNSIYHGSIVDGVAYNSAGTVVDANVFDASANPSNAFTTVFVANSALEGTTLTHGWTTDIAIDEGSPVAVFTARDNGDDTDHRFLYATLDAGAWSVKPLAAAGGHLYAAENDYTGLASIDPDAPNTVVISTTVDPRNGTTTSKYELYLGVTADAGDTWAWEALTSDSTMDNLRPLIPADGDPDQRTVVWMRGTYNSYTSWSTEVAVMSIPEPASAATLAVGALVAFRRAR